MVNILTGLITEYLILNKASRDTMLRIVVILAICSSQGTNATVEALKTSQFQIVTIELKFHHKTRDQYIPDNPIQLFC